MEVQSFIDSIVSFCSAALSIPIKLYTWGLEVCPWVLDWINYFNTEYNIDILGIIPELEQVLEELQQIGI